MQPTESERAAIGPAAVLVTCVALWLIGACSAGCTSGHVLDRLDAVSASLTTVGEQLEAAGDGDAASVVDEVRTATAAVSAFVASEISRIEVMDSNRERVGATVATVSGFVPGPLGQIGALLGALIAGGAGVGAHNRSVRKGKEASFNKAAKPLMDVGLKAIEKAHGGT